MWVADSLGQHGHADRPERAAVTTTIAVGRSPAGVAVGAGSVWVANSGDGTVTRINPRTDKVLATITVGGSPQAITVANGRAWVTIDAQTIRPASRRSAAGRSGWRLEIDVGFHGPGSRRTIWLSWQVLYATCAKLLNYPDAVWVRGRDS